MSVEGLDILLVEDDSNDADLTLYALRDEKVMNSVHVVSDGAEALDFLYCTGSYADRRPAGPPKVILLDLKLPKVDGLEVLKSIKDDPKLRSVPVVMLTSSQEERDVLASYRLGVNSYIVKPVDFKQFEDAIRSAGMYWLFLNRPPVRNSVGSAPRPTSGEAACRAEDASPHGGGL
ncbi:response regulator [Frankia tisae]|uniref:response regulator n=1 Tax=Frankia tisae TaxID=2950104 RepID=UPI0021BEC49E|nr:response regulator [Frankia tisae]